MKPIIPNLLMRRLSLSIGAACVLVSASCGVLDVSITTPTKEEPTQSPTEEVVLTEIVPATEPPTPIDDQYVIPDRPLGIGPWWVFQTHDGLWAINPDASGLTQLSGRISILPVDFADSVASQGGKLAFITSSDSVRRADLSLEILSLPDGSIRKLTSLTSPETEPDPDSVPGDPEFEAVRAVADLHSFAWSPDGNSLAFMGVIGGPTSDLYVYSLDTGDITRLTDGPSQAISPTWSPDSEFIVHSGVDTLGTGAGYLMRGVWAARADNSSVLDLYPIPQGSGNEVVVGWISPDRFLVYTWSVICGPRSLRTYNLADGSEETLWNGFFSNVALDLNRGNVLLTIDEMTANCNEGGVQGIFLFQTGQMTAFEVLEFGVYKMSWVPEVDRFLARFGVDLLAIGPEGEASKLASAPIENDPVIPTDGTHWAFSGTDQIGGAGVWVGDFGQSAGQVFSGGAWGLSWSPGGEGFFFFADGGLHFAPAPNFSPILVTEGIQLMWDDAAAWVQP
jgi:dipeptidyl aminopeptidase/acylaminoacyl peptidase